MSSRAPQGRGDLQAEGEVFLSLEKSSFIKKIASPDKTLARNDKQGAVSSRAPQGCGDPLHGEEVFHSLGKSSFIKKIASPEKTGSQ
jgi:hypothetical protein